MKENEVGDTFNFIVMSRFFVHRIFWSKLPAHKKRKNEELEARIAKNYEARENGLQYDLRFEEIIQKGKELKANN